MTYDAIAREESVQNLEICSNSEPKYDQLNLGEISCDPRRRRETTRQMPSDRTTTLSSAETMTLNGQMFCSGLEREITKEEPDIFGTADSNLRGSSGRLALLTKKAIRA